MTTRLREISTGEVREFPDRWAAWQLGREGSAFELADKPKPAKRTTKKSAAKKRTAKKSAARPRSSGTVPVDPSTSDSD